MRMSRRHGWRRTVLLERVLFNLKAGGAIEGLVYDERGGVLTLRDALVYENGSRSAVRVDGEAIIDIDNVAFAQRLEANRMTPPAPTDDEA